MVEKTGLCETTKLVKPKKAFGSMTAKEKRAALGGSASALSRRRRKYMLERD